MPRSGGGDAPGSGGKSSGSGKGSVDRSNDGEGKITGDRPKAARGAEPSGNRAERAGDQAAEQQQDRKDAMLVAKAAESLGIAGASTALKTANQVAEKAGAVGKQVAAQMNKAIARPVKVARKLWDNKLILVAGVLVAVMLLIVIFFGAFGGSTSVLSGQTTSGGIHDKALDGIGQEALDAIVEAGAAYGVPWTIIAAVAAGATEVGKYSPYDSIDRAPERTGLRRPSAGSALSVAGGNFVPAGTSRLAWAQALAQAIGAPNENAVRFFVAWSKWEQSNPLNNNPLSTREDMPGAVIMKNADGTDQVHKVKRYPDPATGIAASVKNLTGSLTGQLGTVGGNGIPKGYPAVVAALRVGDLPGTSAALTTRDPISQRQYCAPREGKIGENDCAMYRKGLILTKAAKYLSNPATYQKEGGEQILSGPVAHGSSGGTVTTSGGLGGVTIAIVGDSSCAGVAGTALDAALQSKTLIPARTCLEVRQLAEAPGALAGYLTPAAGVLVVSLGTDESSTLDVSTAQTQLAAIVAKASGIPVLVTTVPADRPAAAAINAAATALAATTPTLRVVDVTTTATPSWRSSDGITLSATGASARAELLLAAITSAITSGPGGAVVSPANPAGTTISSFPIVTPPIGGQADQGIGAYLLRAAAVAASDIDAQNLDHFRGSVRTATDFVASELAATADELQAGGWRPSADPVGFWAEAIRRLPIVDPRNPACQTPEVLSGASAAEQSSGVAAAVRVAWSCELGRSVGLRTLTDVNAAGTSGGELTGYTQRTLLLQEAVEVAWAYSQWGSLPCDEKAELAGVFPLTRAVFDTYADLATKARGRCDVGANVQAAARAFVAGETTPPGEARAASGLGDRSPAPGRYNAMIGGWSAMPWVLGSPAARAIFLTDGPAYSWRPDMACLDGLDAWVLGMADAPPCGTPDDIARAARVRAERLYQEAAVAHAQLTPTAPTDGDPVPVPDAGDPNGLTRSFAALLAGRDLLGVDALMARADAFLAATNGVGPNGTRPGVDIILARFSSTAQVVTPRASIDARNDYARLLAALAVDLGGLLRGDTAFKEVTDPWAKLVALLGGGAVGATPDVANLPEAFPNADAFNGAGSATGLDPRMLAAVSAGDPDVAAAIGACRTASGPGPLGLMVLQPATAQLMRIDPCDPAAAVLATAKLLQGQYSTLQSWEQAWTVKRYGADKLTAAGSLDAIPGARAYVDAVAGLWAQLKEQYPSAAAGHGVGGQAVTLAMAQRGKPYVFASRGPDTFDCSGLMFWTYKQLSIKLTSWTGTQRNEGAKVADYHDTGGQAIPYDMMIALAQPGDLLLFKGGDGSLGSGYPGHVGMYVGNGRMVHAPRTGDVVKDVPLTGRSDLMYIRRIAAG